MSDKPTPVADEIERSIPVEFPGVSPAFLDGLRCAVRIAREFERAAPSSPSAGPQNERDMKIITPSPSSSSERTPAACTCVEDECCGNHPGCETEPCRSRPSSSTEAAAPPSMPSVGDGDEGGE